VAATGLTCSASPVFDPHGELLAVLDVSSARRRVAAEPVPHHGAGQPVGEDDRELLLPAPLRAAMAAAFSPAGRSVGLFSEGLLAFDGDGRICAANQSALNLLGTCRGGVLGKPVERFFACSHDELFSRATPGGSTPGRCAPWMAGRCSPACAGPGAGVVGAGRQPRPQAVEPLVCLLDPALQNDFRRACGCSSAMCHLLLRGETGCGKEAFAQAVHPGQ
jgi:transcriptional regulator of acetoin/glycerol metabolism